MPVAAPTGRFDAARELCAPFRAEYDFEPHFLEQEAGWMHYLDEGEGSPLLMVHGNPSWSFLYRELVREFRPSRRVIAPDHIGCGLSDKPQDWPYRLEGHVQNLERLVLELDLTEIDLVVHDWGGAIGFGVATRHPERFRRLVVMNTAAFPADRIPFRINICRAPLLGALAIRGFNAFAGAAVRMAVENKGGLSPEVKRGFLAPYDSYKNRIATLRFVQDIPLSEEHPSYAELARIDAGLSRLRCLPMQIIWGERDFCFTPHFRALWQQRFPEAEVRVLPEAGHYLLEDACEEIIPWLGAFLGS